MNDRDGTIITSRQNPTVVRYSKLCDRKHREREGKFLAEGVKLSAEAISSGAAEVLLAVPELADSKTASAARDNGVNVTVVTAEVLAKISTESAPQGMIAVCGMMESLHMRADGLDPAETLPTGVRAVILDRVRDPGNLGAIMRSAEAFGGVRLLLAGCADIYNARTVRGSMGAMFRLPTLSFSDTAAAVAFAKSAGRRVIGAALDSGAARLGDSAIGADDVVIIGNEGSGISADVLAMCDGKLYIPMSGGESLNCAVAASIVMWEGYCR